MALHIIAYDQLAYTPRKTSFVLPNGTGTLGDVLSTDGTGILSWISVGGGTLASLTDVTLSALTDGNLLVYNGLLGKWENTHSVEDLEIEGGTPDDAGFYGPLNIDGGAYNTVSWSSTIDCGVVLPILGPRNPSVEGGSPASIFSIDIDCGSPHAIYYGNILINGGRPNSLYGGEFNVDGGGIF